MSTPTGHVDTLEDLWLLEAPPEPAARRRVPRFDATTVLTLFVIVLMGVPAQLIFAPLGAAGTPANLVGLLGLMWWANARWVPHLGVDHGFQPVRLLLYAFGASVLASYAWAMAHPLYLDELNGADRAVIMTCAWAGIALIAADGIPDRSRLDVLLRRFVLGGAFLAFLGILQFSLGIDIAAMFRFPGLTANHDLAFIGERSMFRRVAGTSSHPIEFGTVLAMILPLAAHYAFGRPHRTKRDWIALAIIAAAVPMSVSRSAVLGLAVVFAMLFANWNSRQRLQALIAAPVFLVVMRILVPGLLGTIRSLFTYFWADPSITGRTDDYAVVGEFIASSPILGRGFGTFNPIRYLTLDNQYLGTLIETGVIGLTLLVCLFLVGIFCARGARRRAQDAETRDLGQSIAAGLAVAMVTFATFDGFGFPMMTGSVFLYLGCAGALWRLQGRFGRPLSDASAEIDA